MGEKIPEPFCWDASFEVFYAQLDTEHKGLFKGVFDVAADKGNAGALAHLVKVVVDHFAYEEGQMKKANYENFDSHKKLHEEFVGKIKGLKAPVDDATVHFAKDWLVNHIKKIDFKYKGKL
uniref:Hemerythrin n=10 Tax=Annelida TaxID=6340 RepID=A0A1S6QCH4_CLYTO|nr:hemerythrin [Alciopa sp. EP-2017]AQV13614.1 hemerythrin [Clymenella torquata]AQV13618.1 hemerythrin [Delaya leruthi]AQV13638.1 hemerythrin [Galathowenia oculata]AQV13649.1 hemerythrin [Glycera dibranchiata]AQV13687.1 hemerythrin [Myxicola infundibulum]AQV13707.1 hemerythrin [Ninoe sp. EP-2017]AQV13739.1 hemerythrin [Poeobius meseres]AQV13778.1 hemerythrin [Thysanocardia nigra]